MSEADHKSSKSGKRLLMAMVLIIIILVAAGIIFSRSSKSDTPLPPQVTAAVDFPIYFPSAMPDGYALDKNSASAKNQAIDYSISKISNKSQKISISEQALPKNFPSLDSLQKGHSDLKKINIPSGQAIYGASQGVPVAIVTTDTTLLNISGTKNMPLDVVIKLIQSMNSIAE
jgi:hypothetical protein